MSCTNADFQQHLTTKDDLLFLLDLKRAEVAIASGRLDDAFHVLQTSSERNHRSGQKLTDRLVSAFVARATQHLVEERIDDARHDGDKARQLGGRQPVVTDLLRKISAVDADRRDRQQHRHEVLALAHQQMQAGAYSVGVKLLDGLKGDQSAGGAASAERLAESIEAKRAIVDDASARIQAAIDGGRHEAAVAVVKSLSADQRAHCKIAGLTQQVAASLVERGFSELTAGRLDRAAAIGELLRPQQLASPAGGEFEECLSRCRSVREYLRAHQYVEAEAQLTLLSQTINGGAWIDLARTAIADAIRHLNSVSKGPLGLMDDQLNEPPSSAHASALRRQQSTEADPAGSRYLPVRSVLQVDGVGSLLLLSRNVVTIGTSSSSSSGFDVALLTEGPAATISIRRDGDDYFAESGVPFGLNGQQVTRRLLASGDSIAVGARGRLRFQKPVAASSSAVLQITGSRLARRDIRSVVLMSDSLLFGPAGSHFRLPAVESPIVLHCDGAGYVLRETATRVSASQPAVRAASEALPPGDSVVVRDVRFALVDG